MRYRWSIRDRQKATVLFVGLLVAIVLISSVTLFGCRRGGVYTASGVKENNTNNSMEMSYNSFKGAKYTIISLEAGERINININVKTTSGYLNIYVLDNNDNEIYKIENTKKNLAMTIENTGSASILVNNSGSYKIKIKGKHSGSYNIQWDVIKK